MSNSNNIPEEVMTVTLTLDDDSVVECEVITIYEANGKDYIALLPLNENGESKSGDVYLYRYMEEGGEPTLENIEEESSEKRRCAVSAGLFDLHRAGSAAGLYRAAAHQSQRRRRGDHDRYQELPDLQQAGNPDEVSGQHAGEDGASADVLSVHHLCL